MAVDDIGYNYFISLWTDEENESPVKITKVTSTSIEAEVTVTTMGILPGGYGKTNVNVGLYAHRAQYDVWGAWTGSIFSSSVFNSYASQVHTEFPSEMSASSEYTKKYKIVLSNNTKDDSCPNFRTNDEYWVYGYVIDDYANLQTFRDQSITTISSIYDSWENLYHLWGTGNGSYFWPNNNYGIYVLIPPEGYLTLTLNQDDLNSFYSLKNGQIGNIRYTHTENVYDVNNPGILDEYELKHYYRYKYEDQDIWSSWQEASKLYDSENNEYSISIPKNNSQELKIQFARGTTDETYSQPYYETGFYLSNITEEIINIPQEETKKDFKKLDSPEYSIEIWKSRLSDEAKYQFVEYLDNSESYLTNCNVIEFDYTFNDMVNMRFEAEISFSADTHEQALFGSDYKTLFGYAIFVKRISSTVKAVGIYDSTCQDYSSIVYHNFNAKDYERIILKVGSEGIFVNDEKISSQSPVITTYNSYNLGFSIFNLSSIHNFIPDWSWTSGKKLNSSGVEVSDSNYSTSDFIPLSKYDNYTVKNAISDIVCIYDENKTFISYYEDYGWISIETSWATPIDNQYFKISLPSSTLNSNKITNDKSSEFDRTPIYKCYPYVKQKAFTGRLYSFKVYNEEKEEYSFDFSPCYKKDTAEPGLYDNIHKEFYQGYMKSKFSVGPNIASKTYGMLVDISNICVNSLSLSKERNLPDTLSVDIEYVQFKKKLNLEDTKISDVIKPYLVDIVVKRNFETIFTGTLMYAKVTLQAVGKETLTLQAVGYGEQFAKRYINCSYGDMNYPQMAKQIVYDAQHEMNWIDNYDFLSEQTDSGDENDTSYFNGWGALDTNYNSYIPVKAPDTNAYLAHWQNGSIPLEHGCMLQCFKMSCSPLRGGSQWGTTGDYNQFLVFEFYATVQENTTGMPDWSEIEFQISIETDSDNYGTSIYNVTESELIAVSNPENGVKWTKCSFLLNLHKLQGSVKHITITHASTDYKNQATVYLNDFNVYRPSRDAYALWGIHSQETTKGIESNVAATVAYDLGMTVGYFDEMFNNEEYYPTNRVRHYHRVNAKEAMYNLTKLEDQNFEYTIDNDGKFKFKVAEGDLVVRNVATYPGQISEVSIERDASILYNVGYAINQHLYDNEELQTSGAQSFTWTDMTNGCAIDEDSCATYKARVQMVQVDTTTRREIDSEAEGAIYASDEVQNIPTLKFDSNIYNPGNVHIGDAFGVNVNIDDLFDFINGEYRVYGYNLSLSVDHVESMDITLMIPNALQLQLMTFPVTMKNMMNNIKRLQIKSNK